MNPLVSVVIPSWNRSRLLVEAVCSVLAQSEADLEVLVCDDGSTDDSEAAVKAIGDPRVRWLPGPHSGRPAVPRNCGVEQARGEWVAFLDSDDRWLPEKLAAQLSALAACGCLASSSNAWKLRRGRKASETFFDSLPDRIDFASLVSGNKVICSTAIIHRSVLAAVGPFAEGRDVTSGEDYALWLRVATRTDFAVPPGSLAVYRFQSEDSIQRGIPPQALRRAVFLNFLAWSGAARINPASAKLVGWELASINGQTNTVVDATGRRSGWLARKRAPEVEAQIVVRLMGGLGNQMFQYAFGRRLAHDHGVPLRLDTGLLDHPSPGVTRRAFGLHCLSINATRADARVTRAIERSDRLTRFLPSRFRRKRRLVEKTHRYDPAFLKVTPPVLLTGYWQSEEYFAPIRDILLREFSVSIPPEPRAETLLAEIRGRRSVSIHVRRGDYVSNQRARAHHGQCGPAYYRTALERVRQRAGDLHAYVFSEDIAWAEANLALPGNVTFVEPFDRNLPYEDLRLMTACHHHIIANSSFSWWAAWLGAKEDSVVVAPERWSLVGSEEFSKIAPRSWIRL